MRRINRELVDLLKRNIANRLKAVHHQPPLVENPERRLAKRALHPVRYLWPSPRCSRPTNNEDAGPGAHCISRYPNRNPGNEVPARIRVLRQRNGESSTRLLKIETDV
jgi:hypothetical protein